MTVDMNGVIKDFPVYRERVPLCIGCRNDPETKLGETAWDKILTIHDLDRMDKVRSRQHIHWLPLVLVVGDHKRARVDLAQRFKPYRDDDQEPGSPDCEVGRVDTELVKDVFGDERHDGDQAKRQ